eukprot:s171_g48.t2
MSAPDAKKTKPAGGSVKACVKALASGASLTGEEASSAMREIMGGEASPAQVGAFLALLTLEKCSSEIVHSLAHVMRSNALPVEVPRSADDLVVDIVGTGGDGQDTFNISTAAGLLAAGAGVRIVKHGNRAASSKSGAADILEAKQKASSSGAPRPTFTPRSPPPGRLWGFDWGKYGENFKGATIDFFMRLLHSEPGDPPFGTYETLEDADGNFKSKLLLTDNARVTARLRKQEYRGKVRRTKPEAEQAAARVFWDDSLVKERAAKLEPSKKAKRNVKRSAEASAKRKALYGYGTGALGAQLEVGPSQVAPVLAAGSFAFLFARSYHPAMKHVGPIRLELGIRTVFNILGPLTNPAKPDAMVCGVYTASLGRLFVEVFKLLGMKRALVVHGCEGLDELSIEGRSKVWELKDGEIKEYEVQPSDFGVSPHPLSEVAGNSPEENAIEMRELLKGGGRLAVREMVLMNASAALYVAGKVPDFKAGTEVAKAALGNGSAIKTLDAYVAASKGAAK